MRLLLLLVVVLIGADSRSELKSQSPTEDEFIRVLDAQTKLVARRTSEVTQQATALNAREAQLLIKDSADGARSSILAIQLKLADHTFLAHRIITFLPQTARTLEQEGFAGLAIDAGEDFLADKATDQFRNSFQKTEKSYYDLFIGDNLALALEKRAVATERRLLHQNRELLESEKGLLDYEVKYGKRTGFLPANFQSGAPVSAIPAARAMFKSPDARSRMEFADFGDRSLQNVPNDPNGRLWREKGQTSKVQGQTSVQWALSADQRCIYSWRRNDELSQALDVAISGLASAGCRVASKSANQHQKTASASVACTFQGGNGWWGAGGTHQFQQQLQAQYNSENEILVSTNMAGAAIFGTVYELCN